MNETPTRKVGRERHQRSSPFPSSPPPSSLSLSLSLSLFNKLTTFRRPVPTQDQENKQAAPPQHTPSKKKKNKKKKKKNKKKKKIATERHRKMSWQAYVDEHLMCDIDGQGQHLAAAAIVGHDGSIWAQSSSFPQFKPQEITDILKDFEEPGHLAPTGLHIAGTKYMVIQGEAGAVIRGKKGAGGITIKKTGQALVFGIYEEPVTPGQCNMVVERLGDYLADQGL